MAFVTRRARTDQTSGDFGGPAIPSSADAEMTYEKGGPHGVSVLRAVDA
jgi:hypothetical protein